MAGGNINNLRYADDTTLMAESKEKLKSLLMKVKEESEQAGLKLNVQKTKITASGSITSWQMEGEKVETVTDFIFLDSKITVNDDYSHEIKRHLPLWRNETRWFDETRQRIKKQRHHLAHKGLSNQSYDFSSSHVCMWELDHKEVSRPKNWYFRTMVLEKTLESPLDCKEIKLVNPKEYQPWILIGRTDAEAEAPTLWPPNAKSWLTGKDPDAGKDWGQEEKGATEDEIAGWHIDSVDMTLSKLREIMKDS